ncbi:hypothetical protein LZ32DRAFT_608122 [Colletotrichum eremochloae]|nr:hypothetical protein LZ32DRAFT_608122 [Colletotrichum eremochloae]
MRVEKSETGIKLECSPDPPPPKIVYALVTLSPYPKRNAKGSPCPANHCRYVPMFSTVTI